MLGDVLAVVLLLNLETFRLHFGHGANAAIGSHTAFHIFRLLRRYVLTRRHPFNGLSLLKGIPNALFPVFVSILTSQ